MSHERPKDKKPKDKKNQSVSFADTKSVKEFYRYDRIQNDPRIDPQIILRKFFDKLIKLSWAIDTAVNLSLPPEAMKKLQRSIRELDLYNENRDTNHLRSAYNDLNRVSISTKFLDEDKLVELYSDIFPADYFNELQQDHPNAPKGQLFALELDNLLSRLNRAAREDKDVLVGDNEKKREPFQPLEFNPVQNDQAFLDQVYKISANSINEYLAFLKTSGSTIFKPAAQKQITSFLQQANNELGLFKAKNDPHHLLEGFAQFAKVGMKFHAKNAGFNFDNFAPLFKDPIIIDPDDPTISIKGQELIHRSIGVALMDICKALELQFPKPNRDTSPKLFPQEKKADHPLQTPPRSDSSSPSQEQENIDNSNLPVEPPETPRNKKL